MPDGSEECGMIIARLEALEAMQRENHAFFSDEITSVKTQLDRIEKKALRDEGLELGRQEVYAILGKRVTVFFASVGATWALVHWWVAEGGRDWLKSLF